MLYHLIKIILQFFANIAWPLTVLIIFYVFREQVRFVLSKMNYFKTPVVEFGTQSNQDAEGVTEGIGFVTSSSLPNLLKHSFSDLTLKDAEDIINNEAELSNFQAEEKYSRLLLYTKVLLIQKVFNEIYSSIYGSQLKILWHLNSTLSEPKESLKHYYDSGAAIVPQLYAGYSYDDYLSYLSFRGLIMHEGDNILITQRGRDFLKYLVEQGRNTNKPN